MKVLLCVLHFGHVEATDAGDFKVFVDHRWGLALCLGQNDVHKILK